METLIDLFELSEPVVEKYRESYRACVVTPRESMDCSVDSFEETQATRRFPSPSSSHHVSERRLRARLWGTED